MAEVKKNTIVVDDKEISWDHKICPCLECRLYLKNNKSPEDDICRSVRCAYNSQLARAIAYDIYDIMHEDE